MKPQPLIPHPFDPQTAHGLSLPNLDSLDDADLREVDRVLAMATRYIDRQQNARRCRKAGFIKEALGYEYDCEQIYKRIPTDARW